ncbi:MAG: hypothetical protein WBX25_22190, partial [Rhodomicrobium sp.]
CRGAAVKYLSHNRSRSLGSVRLIPSHSGTKQLAGKDAPHLFGDKASLEVTGKDGKDLMPEYPTDHLELARFMGMILEKGRRQLEANTNENIPALPNGGGR